MLTRGPTPRVNVPDSSCLTTLETKQGEHEHDHRHYDLERDRGCPLEEADGACSSARNSTSQMHSKEREQAPRYQRMTTDRLDVEQRTLRPDAPAQRQVSRLENPRPLAPPILAFSVGRTESGPAVHKYSVNLAHVDVVYGEVLDFRPRQVAGPWKCGPLAHPHEPKAIRANNPRGGIKPKFCRFPSVVDSPP